MPNCVKLWRGEWKRNEEDEWHFQADEDEVGSRVMIGENETYDNVETMVRRHYSVNIGTPLVLTFRLPSWMLSPVGFKTPPTTINRTEDLCVLLNVTTSISDLALLVTIGPKRVAEYLFLNRTDFTIGSTTYVVNSSQTAQQRADYERLVYGDREREKEKVMNALFSAQSLMLFHRVTCEMAYADQTQPHRVQTDVPQTEVIVVEDDDEVMVEVNRNNHEIGVPSNAVGGIFGANTNMVGIPDPQAEAPSIFWEVGMDLVNYQNQGNDEMDHETMVNNMRFWEGVLGAGAQIDGNLNLNGTAEVEMETVRDIVSEAAGNVGGNGCIGPNIAPPRDENASKGGSGVGSSSGSAKENAPVLLTEREKEANPLPPVMTDVALVVGHMSNNAEKGGPTNEEERGMALQVMPTVRRAPLYNFTEGGPSGEQRDVPKIIQTQNLTSSEGSSTDGWF